MQITELFTREKSNVGTKMPVFSPSNEKTEEWIMVRYLDCDAFREVSDRCTREAIIMKDEKNTELKDLMQKRHKQEMLIALVADWSFDTEFTKENVATLLENAPYIGDAIDRFAATRLNFFPKEQKPS